MRKYFLLLGLLSIGFSSCKKDFNAAQQAVTDNALIQNYLFNYHITATEAPSGLYYEIINPGTGASPTVSSTVNVTYTGSLLIGEVFSPTSTLITPLSSTIQGWQLGIPRIATGGTILLLIPSALGYGDNSPNEDIPVNSILIFTITLNSFTN